MTTKNTKSKGPLAKAVKPETRPKATIGGNGSSTAVKPTKAPVAKAATPALKPKVAIARKAIAPATEPTKARVKKVMVSPMPSTEAIALLAYFIAEKRYASGIGGDQLSDWIEAERQLLVEQKVK